eukprot:COSAG01_NODE_1918_length_8905_cov_2.532591_8_plen_98_part_00
MSISILAHFGHHRWLYLCLVQSVRISSVVSMWSPKFAEMLLADLAARAAAPAPAVAMAAGAAAGAAAAQAVVDAAVGAAASGDTLPALLGADMDGLA